MNKDNTKNNSLENLSKKVLATSANEGGRAEIYTREVLAIIHYLLKYTDEKHLSNDSAIARHLKDELNIPIRRQRIPFILKYLADYSELTMELGFIVKAVPTGKNKDRFKYFVSKRILNMTEINHIYHALNAQNHIAPSKVKEIIESLKRVYPSKEDIEHVKEYGHEVVIPRKTPKQIKIAEIINNAMENALPVIIHQMYGKDTVRGIISNVFYQGDKNYIIDISDAELGKFAHVLVSDIADINYDVDIYRLPDITPIAKSNLSSSNKNKFMSIKGMSNFMFMENSNENLITNESEKVEISFDISSHDVLYNFMEKFNINENKYHEQVRNIEESYNDNNEGRINIIHVKETLDLEEFIKWASSKDVILKLHNIVPNIINERLAEQYSVLANILRNKVR